MTSRDPPREPVREPVTAEEEDLEGGPPRVPLGDWLRFGLGALRRRWAVALGVFLLVLGAAALYYRLKGPTYRVEAKILAQRQGAILSGRPGGEDHPARSAWELIHRRDNLAALAQQTGLLDGPPIEDQPGLAARLLGLIRPEAAPVKEEPVDAVVRVLDKRLRVMVEEGTILLQLDWPEPRQGYHLVQAALQGFLEARHLHEVQAIDDVIAQLEGRTARLKAELDAA
ncbi:MAG: lipopolysaccharide biosynthesis protein, partial [Anaeromyxobacteraceae bacterium]|nr:lipopolysaccharide biosynthesis protein [Anaeromyxobacteraceae bacterium]